MTNWSRCICWKLKPNKQYLYRFSCLYASSQETSMLAHGLESLKKLWWTYYQRPHLLKDSSEIFLRSSGRLYRYASFGCVSHIYTEGRADPWHWNPKWLLPETCKEIKVFYWDFACPKAYNVIHRGCFWLHFQPMGYRWLIPATLWSGGLRWWLPGDDGHIRRTPVSSLGSKPLWEANSIYQTMVVVYGSNDRDHTVRNGKEESKFLATNDQRFWHKYIGYSDKIHMDRRWKRKGVRKWNADQLIGISIDER